MHAHKALGALALFDFARRLCLLAATGDPGMDAGPATLAWLAVHACSALAFQLRGRSSSETPEVREIREIRGIPEIPEMRWHTGIFAARALLAAALMWLQAQPPWSPALWWAVQLMPRPVVSLLLVAPPLVLRFALVVATMLAADITSYACLRDEPASAVEGQGQGQGQGRTAAVRDPHAAALWALNVSYSVSQACGTLVVLASRSLGAVLFVLLPVQVAPLLMALVKKGVLRQAGWHLWYALSVLAAFYVAALSPATSAPSSGAPTARALSWAEAAGVLAAFAVARIALRVNKYVFWASVAVYLTSVV